MAVNYSVVVRTYTDEQGNPLAGWHPRITLSFTAGDGHGVTIAPATIACSTDASGRLVGPDGNVGVRLAANDSLVPANSYYTITQEPYASAWSFQVLSAAGSPLDLESLSPTIAGAAVISYVTPTQLSAALGGVKVLVPTPVKTAAYTASSLDTVVCDTAAGPWTGTMPPAVVGAQVTWVNVTVTGTAPVTLACAGTDVFTLPASSGPVTVAPGESISAACLVAGRWSLT